MDYATYSADDFIKDDYFQQWVLAPDARATAFWEKFLNQYPHQAAIVAEARQFLLLVGREAEIVPTARLERLKGRINQAIDEQEFLTAPPLTSGQRTRR